MRFPLHVTTDMIGHQVSQALRGHKRYPFVLMLEPLYTCNLACIGCAAERHTGKDQAEPDQIEVPLVELALPVL